MRTREAIIVVQRGAEFLVVHRSPERGGYWHLVSGGVENGETEAEAAVRELFEETQLEASVQALDYSFMHEGIQVEAFAAAAPDGWEPSLDHEHDDYRWLPRDEAAELLYWPEPQEIVRTLA